MRTVEVEVYTFDELSEEAKQKAIEENREYNIHYEWWDSTYDDFKRIAEILGVGVDNMAFSGFWSQGDGASFTGSYSYAKQSTKKIREYAPKDSNLHDIADRLFDVQKEHFYRLSAIVKHSGRYYHEKSNIIDVYKEGYAYDLEWYGRKDHPSLVDASETIKDCLRDLMRWLYRQLQSEYEYLTSDKVVSEALTGNMFEFKSDGSSISTCLA